MDKYKFQETCPSCGSFDEDEGGDWDMVNEYCRGCEYDAAAETSEIKEHIEKENQE